jgi:hypothetical protein
MRIERIARTGQDSAAIETAATKTVEWARRNLSVLTRNGLRTRPRPALEGIEAPVTLGDVAHRFFCSGSDRRHRVDTDVVGPGFGMGCAKAQLAELREATKPKRQAMVST